MTAQLYVNEEDLWIFDSFGWCIAKLPMRQISRDEATVALKRNRMRRREEWQKTPCGWKAKVRWIEK